MKLLQGKVKTVFETENAEEVMIEYHDKVTAGNGEKEDFPAGKGSLCCQISSILFDKLFSKEFCHFLLGPSLKNFFI